MTLDLPTAPPIPVDHKIIRKQAKDIQADLLFDFNQLIVDGWTTLVKPVRNGLPALIAEMQVPGARVETHEFILKTLKFQEMQRAFTTAFPEAFKVFDKELQKLIVSSGVVGQKYGQNLLQLYTSESFSRMARRDLAALVLKDYTSAIAPRLADDVYAKAWSGLSKEMISNMRKGLPPETITKYAIDKGMGQGLNHILLVARDQSLRAFREADLEFFRSTDKVVAYQRTASHDGRVCMLCLSLDGKVYRKNETPELHAQDRCDFLPLLEGQEPYEWTNGDDWLRSQPEQRQKEILGPARFKLFKEGKPLNAFSTTVDHPIWGPTLKEVPLKSIGQGTAIPIRTSPAFTPLPPASTVPRVQELPPLPKAKPPVTPSITPSSVIQKVPGLQSTTVPKAFSSAKEAEAYAKKQWPDVKWSLGKMDPSLAQEVIESYANLRKEFPEAAARLKAVSMKNLVGSSFQGGSVETAHAMHMTSVKSIVMSPSYFEKRYDLVQSELRGVKAKWIPTGVNSVNKPATYIFTHEFGHQVQAVAYDLVDNKTWNKFLLAFNKANGDSLGKYSTTAQQEKFAEAFAQMILSPRENWSEATSLMWNTLQTPEFASLRVGIP